MKKISFLLPFLAAFATALTQNNIFFDDFSSNINNWSQSTSGGSIYVINNGKMIMENSDDGSRWVGKSVYITTGRNYSISVSSNHTGGIDNYGYGLYFGAKDGHNGYAFQIASNGHYLLAKFENGQTINLVNWTKNSYINTGNYITNELMIKKEDGYWKLYVNNYYLTSVSAGEFYGNYIGFINNKNQRVEFDNLTVKEWEGGSATMKELFFDEFSSNYNNWAVSNTDAYSSRINNGKFVIDVIKDKETYATFRTIELDENKDFTVSLSAIHTSGADSYGYGIIFGLSDIKNCYEFKVSTNGMYSLLKYENGSFSWLINPLSSSYINKGNYAVNDIMIKKTGSTWNFYINNQWVNSYTAQRFFASKFGMVVNNVQRVEFDNFRVSGVSKYSGTSTTTTTADIPDYSGGTKINQSGKFCSMFDKIIQQSSDKFKQFTGTLVKQNQYDKEHQSTLTITDAARTYVVHTSYSSTFRIDFGEYSTAADAAKKIEDMIPGIESCTKYKIVKSLSAFPGNSTYYLTEKTTTGFKNTGYYLYAASKQSNNAQYSYTATMYIPDKPYSDVFTYVTNAPVASEFSNQLKKLIQESRTDFKNIKGDKTGEDFLDVLYATSYKMTGTKLCELHDISFAIDYYAYFEKNLSSEQEANKAFLNLLDKVKKALGNKYMFKISELTYSKKYTFYLQSDISGKNEGIQVELYTNVNNTYDVRLIVLGSGDSLF